MLTHPSGPPSPRTPRPWGNPGFSELPKKLHHLASPGLGHVPLFVFEEGVPGGPQALHRLVWRKVRRGRRSGNVSIRAPGPMGETAPLLCDCVAERLPLSVSPGQPCGGGPGAGWKGLPILYQRCYISVMGWGGEGVTGAIEVETPPPLPPGQPMFLFVPSPLNSLVFFFSWMEMHVNFLKVLFTTGRECATHSSPSLPTPPRLLGPLSPDLSSLKPPPPQLLPSSHLAPGLSFVLSPGFQSTNFPKHKAVFPLGWEEARDSVPILYVYNNLRCF